MPDSPNVSRFSWADNDQMVDALSLSVLTGIDEGQVRERLGITALPVNLTWDQARDRWDIDALPFQMVQLTERLVIVEPNGWLCSLPDSAGTLSQGGRLVNVFWNVNAVMSFLLADNGEIIRQFDPLLYDQGEKKLPEEEGLPFGLAAPRAAALALLERLSGFGLDRDWLVAARRPTYFVPAPR